MTGIIWSVFAKFKGMYFMPTMIEIVHRTFKV